jgi:hypothetical protein
MSGPVNEGEILAGTVRIAKSGRHLRAESAEMGVPEILI